MHWVAEFSAALDILFIHIGTGYLTSWRLFHEYMARLCRQTILSWPATVSIVDQMAMHTLAAV